MNTRLQVEHPVTEAVTGLDLVEWQFRVAAGEPLPLKQSEIRCSGAAIEARVYAEDPEHGFLPSAGRIHVMNLKGEEGLAGVRVDTGFTAGDSVTPYYDPMIAKVIVHGASRAEALAALLKELDDAVVIGPKTNLAFLGALLRSWEFEAGTIDTGFIDLNLGRLGAEPHPPDKRAVHAAARLLIERRDKGRASPLSPFDPWRIADSFELIGSRRIGLDVAVDGVPARVHLIEGANVDPFADGEGAAGGEITLYETDGGAYAFAGGRQAFVELIDPFAKAEAGLGRQRLRDPRADERAPRRAGRRGRRDGRSGAASRGRRGDEDGARPRRPARGRRARPRREPRRPGRDGRADHAGREGGRRGAGRRRLTSRPASASVSGRARAAEPPGFNQSASSGESERKRTKAK